MLFKWMHIAQVAFERAYKHFSYVYMLQFFILCTIDSYPDKLGYRVFYSINRSRMMLSVVCFNAQLVLNKFYKNWTRTVY